MFSPWRFPSNDSDLFEQKWQLLYRFWLLLPTASRPGRIKVACCAVTFRLEVRTVRVLYEYRTEPPRSRAHLLPSFELLKRFCCLDNTGRLDILNLFSATLEL